MSSVGRGRGDFPGGLGEGWLEAWTRERGGLCWLLAATSEREQQEHRATRGGSCHRGRRQAFREGGGGEKEVFDKYVISAERGSLHAIDANWADTIPCRDGQAKPTARVPFAPALLAAAKPAEQHGRLLLPARRRHRRRGASSVFVALEKGRPTHVTDAASIPRARSRAGVAGR